MKTIEVLSQKIKNIWKILCYPWHCFKMKKPLLSFIVSRLVTMFAMLFPAVFAVPQLKSPDNPVQF